MLPVVLLALFFLALGLCTGSFLNVVIWRLPYRGQEVTYAGRTGKLSLHWPPSHCPACHKPVPPWFNVPVAGWLLLRGRCAGCKGAIGVRYPLVELAVGVCFCALYLAYAVGGWQAGLLANLSHAWPTLVVQLVFVAALLAASGIDADWYIIPFDVPVLLGVVALAACFFSTPGLPRINPGGAWARAAVGGTVGLAAAAALLFAGLLPRSFPEESTDADLPGVRPATGAAAGAAAAPADVVAIPGPPALARSGASLAAAAGTIAALVVVWLVADARTAAAATLAGGVGIFLLGILARNADTADVTDEVAAESAVPRARREVLKEALFMALPLACGIAAIYLPVHLPAGAFWGRLAAVLLGALLTGGLVWFIRIGGTLLFGRVAMGMGDVHLMAAVGAVVGAKLGIIAFFLAPFVAILWAIVLLVMKKQNVLPFGPWLAVGAIAVLLCGRPILRWYSRYIPALAPRNSRPLTPRHPAYIWPGVPVQRMAPRLRQAGPGGRAAGGP